MQQKKYFNLPADKWADGVVIVNPETGEAAGSDSFPMPVKLITGNVVIEGPITVSNEVEIKNDSGSPIPTEPLGIPTVARQLVVTATTASVVLTAGCKRLSIRARGCDMRYVVGVGAQTANASMSHFIGQDERLDIAVPAGATIAAIREATATANGSLAITELG
jgi:hypothetical protein